MSLWSRIERRLSDLADELIPDEFHQQVLSARDLIDEGHPAEAAELLEAMLGERPDHAGALSLLGAARLELGEAEAAFRAFGRSLDQRDDVPETWLGMGEARLALADADGAVQAFRAAVKWAGGERSILAAGYRGLGISYRAVGDLDKAIRELRKAVAENVGDPIARAALGEALLSDQRISADEARRHLDLAVETGQAPSLAYLALGRIALGEGDGERAREHFARALELANEESGSAGESGPGNPASHAKRNSDRAAGDSSGGGFDHAGQALVGLGDAAMLLGDPQAAHGEYLRALQSDSRSAAIHARIGDVHRTVCNADAALQSYERSLTMARDAEVLRRALDTALEAGKTATAVRLANDLLILDPGDTRAIVARGVALARDGQRDAARATFHAALAQRDDVEAHLALGRLELEDDPGRAAGARAAIQALTALRVTPSSERARQLLAEARAREFGEMAESRPGSNGGGDVNGPGQDSALPSDASHLYRIAETLRRVAVTRPELGELAGEAAQAAADFDQPLLVTVMGEFSSGKSTFVNAFIGADVAPTGITPTTATINVVKYGRERGGRIVYRDGRIETVDWDDLFSVLRALPAERVRHIEVVEILLPLAQLERVNIVDTPGLNSILPEHEEVARGFIARADAVIWLFTASQAGKASERKALANIRDQGKRVLGVLNKMDQLVPSDLTQLVDYVRDQLGDIVEVVVPLSARLALVSKDARPGDERPEEPPGEGSDGNWPSLHAALEERFFAQARELKRAALDRKLAGVIARARAIASAQRDHAVKTAAALRGDAEQILHASFEFIDEVVLTARRALTDAAEQLHHRAAREVLDLVRPRQLPFGSHSAAPADRDYLVSLLESGYEAALESSRRDVIAALRKHSHAALLSIAQAADAVGNQAVSDVTRTAEDALRLIEAQVFDRTFAYLRGYLRGGYIADFFYRDLPKLELAEEPAYQALIRNAPDLDGEIAVRLAAAGTQVLQSLAARLEHWAGVAHIAAHDIDVGIGRALESLDAQRLAAIRLDAM
ncbi:MAG: dynamin family protein [Proteobacteria bacterium]|nr:dynamin family protein [Pseudomonadota bacterium]